MMRRSQAALLAAALAAAPGTPHPAAGQRGSVTGRATAAAITATPPLAARIAAAGRGDTVRIAAGVHTGPWVVDRAIVLIGEPGAILDGGGRGTTLTLAAPGTVVRGVTLRDGGLSLDGDDAAVKLVGCDGCTVADVHIERSLHGIYVQSSTDVRLERNRIRGTTVLAESRRGNGIHLFDSEGTRVRGNTIRATRDGIYFSFASRSIVEDNDVAEVRYGLHYMYSDDNRFARNRFVRNAAGAAIMHSKRIVFEDNDFAEHVGHRAYGILLQTAEEVMALGNRIEGNLVGIFLDNTTRSVFRGNRIVGNGTGIDFISSAEANTFVGNVIAHNRTPVRRPAGGGANAFAADGRGNFWGDRAVFDLDGDGIGDRPYRAEDPFASLAAARPVLEAFAGTPAARALSWAERAFPVFDLPHVEDPHPLAVAPAFTAENGAGDGAAAPLLALLAVPFAAGIATRAVRRRCRP